MQSTEGPLVLIPGLLCDERLWGHQAAAFDGSRTIYVSDVTLDSTIEQMAKRLLDQAPSQFSLAALSMGGYVALEVMRTAPERVTRLALLDTMAGPDDPARQRARQDLLALAEVGRFKGVTPHLLPRLIHSKFIDTKVAKVVMEMAEAIGKEGFIRQQRAIISREDYRAVLPEINIPTLVVVGHDDQVTPRDEAVRIHRAIPSSKLVIIGDCGHLPPLEQPELTTQLLAEWLAWPALKGSSNMK